ncbi:MAG: energy-coupling factor ABC transporter substrate-binding protein [Anaerolineae bacterium]|nr:energy-coupling factor ABC transporter substrate-binding protein [Anaerolineae bacterium]MDW8070925.1 energy-coupling factor ABC transporter substrate-binding protein [Anaerolineae bacterium]
MKRPNTPFQNAPVALYLLSAVVVVVLIVLPFVVASEAEFAGADEAGSEAVVSIAPDYDPTWIQSIWEPPSGETESMLFALQAAVGGILIGYFFGYKRGQGRTVKRS